MITVEKIEQLHVIAKRTLRKHGGNVEKALEDFLFAQADAGLAPDPSEWFRVQTLSASIGGIGLNNG